MARSGGFGPWLMQRVTALVVAVFVLYATGYLFLVRPDTYNEWRAWYSSPWVNLGTGLFFLALILHAWVGIRDIIMDYVKPVGLRLFAMALVIVSLAACGLWILQVMTRVTS